MSESTDILFIHPGNQKKTYQKLADEFTAIATPAWTCLLANVTREHGKSTAVYDANLEGWDENTPHKLSCAKVLQSIPDSTSINGSRLNKYINVQRSSRIPMYRKRCCSNHNELYLMFF